MRTRGMNDRSALSTMDQHRCALIVQFEHLECQGSNSTENGREIHVFEAGKYEGRDIVADAAALGKSSVTGYGFLGRERDGALSGTTFSLLFSSARIAFASSFIGFPSGATFTKCWR